MFYTLFFTAESSECEGNIKLGCNNYLTLCTFIDSSTVGRINILGVTTTSSQWNTFLCIIILILIGMSICPTMHDYPRHFYLLVMIIVATVMGGFILHKYKKQVYQTMQKPSRTYEFIFYHC